MNPASPASNPDGGGQDPAAHPKHVAIIMDGNGRWASARNLPRSIGHERGVEALRKTVEAAQGMGLSYLTVYSFSTENWRRPVSEVNALFGLLKAYVKRDLARLHKEGVRVRVLGTRQGLPDDIRELVDRAEATTRENTAFNLCIAFNYGGREEILRAVHAAASAIRDGTLSEAELTEEQFGGFLDTAGIPDPDLIVRTSGEYRLSNFLIWQSAYSELVFMDVLWPDFRGEHLQQAIDIFMGRERRYGGLATGAA